AMVRRDWSSKKMHSVWRDLVYSTWWTDVRTRTDTGALKVRGFQGEYEVSAQAGDKSVTEWLFLPEEGAKITLTLR
nr:hypothetical protein [Bryobacter sp.]